jgi:hypothetical protein
MALSIFRRGLGARGIKIDANCWSSASSLSSSAGTERTALHRIPGPTRATSVRQLMPSGGAFVGPICSYGMTSRSRNRRLGLASTTPDHSHKCGRWPCRVLRQQVLKDDPWEKSPMFDCEQRLGRPTRGGEAPGSSQTLTLRAPRLRLVH